MYDYIWVLASEKYNCKVSTWLNKHVSNNMKIKLPNNSYQNKAYEKNESD